MQQTKPDPVIAREILTYLGTLPLKLQQQGNHAAGDLALSLGNCLLWLHHHLEDGPQLAQDLSESPRSVYALAKQLQHVGRTLLDQKAQDETAKLKEKAAELMENYHRLNTLFLRAMAGGGIAE